MVSLSAIYRPIYRPYHLISSFIGHISAIRYPYRSTGPARLGGFQVEAKVAGTGLLSRPAQLGGGRAGLSPATFSRLLDLLDGDEGEYVPDTTTARSRTG